MRPDDERVNGRRPADVVIPSWFPGAPACFDFAVSSPHRQTARALAFQGMGRAAQEYEVVKRTHLDTDAQCRQQGMLFIPLVAEPSGGWGPNGADTLRRLARASDMRLGEEPGTGWTRLLQ